MAPSTKWKRRYDGKLRLLIGIIMLWGLLAGFIFYLSGSYLEETFTLRKTHGTSFAQAKQVLTCRDASLWLPSTASLSSACYDPREKMVEVRIRENGNATITSLMINVIGTEGMVMHDAPVSLDDSRIKVISIPYDIDDEGIVDFVEIVPRFISRGVEHHCEDAKVLVTDVLTC